MFKVIHIAKLLWTIWRCDECTFYSMSQHVKFCDEHNVVVQEKYGVETSDNRLYFGERE